MSDDESRPLELLPYQRTWIEHEARDLTLSGKYLRWSRQVTRAENITVLAFMMEQGGLSFLTHRQEVERIVDAALDEFFTVK